MHTESAYLCYDPGFSSAFSSVELGVLFSCCSFTLLLGQRALIKFLEQSWRRTRTSAVGRDAMLQLAAISIRLHVRVRIP
jgi:hypothetical protein